MVKTQRDCLYSRIMRYSISDFCALNFFRHFALLIMKMDGYLFERWLQISNLKMGTNRRTKRTCKRYLTRLFLTCFARFLINLQVPILVFIFLGEQKIFTLRANFQWLAKCFVFSLRIARIFKWPLLLISRYKYMTQ